MTMSHPNFKTSYFQQPVLNRVVGEPDYNSFLSLFQQVKANASSTPCTLGGGGHGHLGLVVSVAKYMCIVPNTPYSRATRPADFSPIGTSAEIDGKKLKFDRKQKLLEETNLLEQTLIEQLKEAINKDYFESKIDLDTGLVNGTVHEVICLFFLNMVI